MTFVIVVVICLAVLGYVLWPLRAGAPAAGPDPQLLLERERVAVAKDRKIDELRELLGDREAGKLDAADAKELERRLRHEAADLLHRLDELDERLAAGAGAEGRTATGEPVG